MSSAFSYAIWILSWALLIIISIAMIIGTLVSLEGLKRQRQNGKTISWWWDHVRIALIVELHLPYLLKEKIKKIGR